MSNATTIYLLLLQENILFNDAKTDLSNETEEIWPPGLIQGASCPYFGRKFGLFVSDLSAN